MAKKISPKKMKRIKTVFGHDVKFDDKGRPIEQGIGAPGHETMNHYAALAKATRIENKVNPSPENAAAAKAAADLYDKKRREMPDSVVDDDEEEDEDEEIE